MRPGCFERDVPNMSPCIDSAVKSNQFLLMKMKYAFFWLTSTQSTETISCYRAIQCTELTPSLVD